MNDQDLKRVGKAEKALIAQMVKRKTNADRIRTMRDEELAKLLNRGGCPPEIEVDCPRVPCLYCWLKWLRQEAKDEP